MKPITMKQARINAGLSIEKAAKMLGVTKKRLEAYEKDSSKISLQMAIRLPCVYKMTLSDFWFGKEAEYEEWLNNNYGN